MCTWLLLWLVRKTRGHSAIVTKSNHTLGTQSNVELFWRLTWCFRLCNGFAVYYYFIYFSVVFFFHFLCMVFFLHWLNPISPVNLSNLMVSLLTLLFRFVLLADYEYIELQHSLATTIYNSIIIISNKKKKQNKNTLLVDVWRRKTQWFKH